MTNDPFREMKIHGKVGLLYPHDVRFLADDKAYCNPLADGTVQFRLHAEPIFTEVLLVFNDGTVHTVPLAKSGEDGRYVYWEGVIQPASDRFTYSFALMREDGKHIYWGKQGLTHAVETPMVLDLAINTPFSTPEWAEGAVVYQIFPERFANGDPSNDPPDTVTWGSTPEPLQYQGGDLQGITQNLDYLQDLGVDILYLNPINTAPSNHKYDAIDYYHVDPAFGGNEALRELVTAVHERGMRIILDASFNHCHPHFFAFQDLMEKGAASAYVDWFTITDFPVRVRMRPHLVADAPQPWMAKVVGWAEAFCENAGIPLEIHTDDGPIIDPTYEAWFNTLSMPKLNQDNPETRAYFLEVATYWLREFKLDGWRMDVVQFVAPDFWDDFRVACKRVSPDCLLLSEIWGSANLWLQGNQFDGTMNYIFRDLMLGYFAKQTMDTETFMAGITRMLHIHASQAVAVSQNLLGSHDSARFLTESGGQRERLALATFCQLTMPGMAGLYYGDEIGMAGENDPHCRGAFPWHDKGSWELGQYALVRGLARLRGEMPALRRGNLRFIWSMGDAFAFTRTYKNSSVLVIVNRGGKVADLFVPIVYRALRVLWGTGRVTGEAGGVRVGLGASAGMVIGL